MNIVARRQLRLVTVAVVEAITGVTVESPGDWATVPSKLPSIKVRTPMDRKAAVTRGMPEFDTTVTVQILATLEALTGADAQDQIEALGQLLEAAFFTAQPIVRLCSRFPTVVTQTEISADGEKHVARMEMSVECDLFESFDPYDPAAPDAALFPDLSNLRINVDTLRPFDPTGTYADPPFPGSVTSAPRTAGPDGRNEGELQIDLST